MAVRQELYDRCYECTAYGDDFYFDEEVGEIVSSCDNCWVDDLLFPADDDEEGM